MATGIRRGGIKAKNGEEKKGQSIGEIILRNGGVTKEGAVFRLKRCRGFRKQESRTGSMVVAARGGGGGGEIGRVLIMVRNAGGGITNYTGNGSVFQKKNIAGWRVKPSVGGGLRGSVQNKLLPMRFCLICGQGQSRFHVTRRKR